MLLEWGRKGTCIGKPGGKRLLGRPRRRSVNNINMDFVEIERSGIDWIGLSLNRNKWRAHVNAVMSLRVP
jgi:hypothetical protein